MRTESARPDHRGGHRSVQAIEWRWESDLGASPIDGLRVLRSALLRHLCRRGMRRDQAEDAIQEAFLRLCLRARVEEVRNPAALLTTIVRRIRIDRWRQAQRQERRRAGDVTKDLALVDPSPQPAQYLKAEQRLERMRQRLDELSPRTREAFFRHRLEGLTYAQIAAAMGISMSAVEKHIARAALALADEEHGG